MREIKFKAKKVRNGEWVYGDLVINTETDTYRIFSNFANVVHGDITDYGLHYCSGQLNEVYPETVCQYTGMKDKNGVRIFEGDIFQYRKHDGYMLPDFTGEILFMMGCFGYVATSENMGEAFRSFSEIDELKKDFLDHIEIIGNIHDKAHQKQAIIDMMSGDEEIGLYNEEK